MTVAENIRNQYAPYHAIQVSEHVYWVGAIDWAIRDFHGYATERGTTYNAFLILADKVTLIDTVKAPFQDEMLARIASVIDPRRIDYLISNHAEMDHSGCLPGIITAVQPEAVYASTMGVKALHEHFRLDTTVTPVKDGERMSLGNLHLTFLETRMLHWPDSMFSYLEEEQVLFSNDAFGMHLAGPARFDDENVGSVLDYEAGKYFANILLPYAHLITKLLTRWNELQLPVQVIAPDHGPLWRSGVETILARYGQWAAQRPTAKAVVVYDTMWQSTEMMARAVGEGLVAGGAQPVLMPLGASPRSDVVTELLGAGALLVGSPTLNNNLFPTLADLLTYIKGLKPRNRIGAAFGSYGWSGEGVAQAQEYLTAMGIEVIGEAVKARYVPDADDLARCHALGALVAESLLQKLKE